MGKSEKKAKWTRPRWQLVLATAFFSFITLLFVASEKSDKQELPEFEGQQSTADRATPSLYSEAPPIASANDTSSPQTQPPDSSQVLTARGDHFQEAEVLEIRETPASRGTIERIRLLQVEEGSPQVRVEEKLRKDPSGEWIITSQIAMSADRFIAQPLSSDARRELEEYARTRGHELKKSNPRSSIHTIIFSDHEIDSVPANIERITDLLGGDLIVEPDLLYFPMALPNDTETVRQWALERMGAAVAWDETTGSEDLVVAVLDSGIDLDHSDLAGNLWRNPREISGNGEDDDGNDFTDDINGWDFVGADSQPDDTGGHGSHVSGIIGAHGNNGRGIAGVNWRVKILPFRVRNRTFSTSHLLGAMEYVRSLKTTHDVPVVATNNSYGSLGFSRLMRNAIAEHRDAGIIFVAAAGNEDRDNDDLPNYPASYGLSNIISVASTTGADNLSSFSNYGSESVHIAAPGSKIYSTIPNGSYGYKDGTSMASPQVAGAVALVTSANPSLDWRTVRDLILSSAEPTPDLVGKVSSNGRLSLRRAVDAAVGRERPSLRLITPRTKAVRMPAAGFKIALEAALEIDGRAVNATTGSFRWEVEPELGDVQIEDPGSLKTVATMASEGDFRIGAVYSDGSYEIVDGVYVTVGKDDLLTDDLSAWWKFDETEGTNAQDSSGRSRGGTVEGAVWESGRVGGALRFNGLDQSVSFPSPSLNRFTLSAWVRTESAGNSVFPRVFNLPEFLLYLGRRDNDFEHDQKTVKFFADRSQSDGVWNSRTNVVDDQEWIHVAASFDGSDINATPSLYVNGRNLEVGAQSVPRGSRRSSGTTGFIGDDGEDERALDGLIDDARIYHRILDPLEVAALAEEPELNSVPLVTGANSLNAAVGQAVVPAVDIDDHELPIQTLQFSWETIAGPEDPNFSDPSDLNTQIEFTAPGDYRLRIYADDGQAIGVADLIYTVSEGTGTNPPPGSERVAEILWPGAIDLGDGWKDSGWFGFLNGTHDPWIFHSDHGWMYALIGEGEGVWFYTEELGWLWTSPSQYPNLFWQNEATWLWFLRDSSSTRQFFNYTNGLWVTFS